MQFAMVKSADGHGVFVADLAAKRPRLGEANVMRFARNPAADDARLRCDVFAVQFVAQSDGLRRDTATARPGPFRDDDRRRLRPSTGSAIDRASPVPTASALFMRRVRRLICGAGPIPRSQPVFRGKPLREGRRRRSSAYSWRTGSVDPVRRFVRRFQLIEVPDQLVAQRGGVCGIQRHPSGRGDTSLCARAALMDPSPRQLATPPGGQRPPSSLLRRPKKLEFAAQIASAPSRSPVFCVCP